MFISGSAGAKGSFLSSLYPEGTRTSNDVDMLINIFQKRRKKRAENITLTVAE